MFKISIKYLYLIAAISVATVIVSNKVFEDSQRHITYNPVHALKTKIENDLADHIKNNLSKTIEADRLELAVRTTTDIALMKDLGDYRLEKVEILANRKLSAEEWGTLKTSTKVFLRSSGLVKNPTKTKFLLRAKRQYLSMKDRKWLGAMLLIAVALLITSLAFILHSRWLKMAMKKLVLSRAYSLEQIDECKPIPYGLSGKVDAGSTSQSQVATWRELIDELRARQVLVGSKNSLAGIESKY